MNVQSLLMQLFEERGYKREKQVRLKKLGFMGPAPGTYRFDPEYSKQTDYTRAYLTTSNDKEMLEFFVKGTLIHILVDLSVVVIVNLTIPNSLDKLREMLDDHS